MKINVFEYFSEGEMPPAFRVGEEIRRNSKSLRFDTEKLWPVLLTLNKYSVRIYSHLLKHLESSDKPIKMRRNQLKMEATNINNNSTFMSYVYKLIESGLVFCEKPGVYYINPVYVWTEGSEVCFDSDRLPFYKEDPALTATA